MLQALDHDAGELVNSISIEGNGLVNSLACKILQRRSYAFLNSAPGIPHHLHLCTGIQIHLCNEERGDTRAEA